MAQISRPFQIALAVVVLFAGVWLFVLQGHSSSGSSGPSAGAPVASSSAPAASSSASSSSSQAAASATKPSTPASATASSTHIYHGAAPGVEGLTRAIVKAHQAVTASGEAPQQPASSSSASTPAATASVPAAKTSTPKAATTPKASTTPKAATTTKAATTPKTSPSTSSSTGAPARQTAIEAKLKAGTPVVLLFWNPHGAEDLVDHRALAQLVRNDAHARRPVAVQEATASQVSEFGSITRGLQIDATPTILVINPHDQATVLTGVQDVFTIEQTIEESLHPEPQS